MDWDKELEALFDLPIFDDIKASPKRATSSDRLVKSFLEIVDFVDSNGREPQNSSPDMKERTLASTLASIRNDASKRAKCLPYDSGNLLVEKPKSADDELEELFNNPIFDTPAEVQSIFDVPEYMKRKEVAECDYIARHVVCENFDKYEAGFVEIHTKLRDGRCRLVKFKEEHLQEGAYFVVGGVVVLLAKVGHTTRNKDGKIDGRTLCIYDNGTQSDILLRTLGKSLYKDGYSVRDVSLSDEVLLKKQFTVTDADTPSGYIYVLRSKSTNPEIANIKNLYKIGFTTQRVEERIANAKQDSTYLYADVEIVASWQVYNIKAVAFENAIHHLFRAVRLQLSADDARPKEWYIVPFRIIEEAVSRLVRGESLKYDPALQCLITED